MRTFIKGTICAVAATYSLSYDCTGPDCDSLETFPIQNWKCVHINDNVLSCSNQRICTSSAMFKDVFEFDIDTFSLCSSNTYTVNGKSFSNAVSVSVPRRLSRDDSKRSLIFSRKTSLLTAIAGALSSVPSTAEATLIGIYDTSSQAIKNPASFFSSLKDAAASVFYNIQSAVLPAGENILLELAQGRYEDAVKDSAEFALESVMKAAIVVSAPESAGLDLPLLLMSHAYASMVVNAVADAIDGAVEKAKASSSASQSTGSMSASKTSSVSQTSSTTISTRASSSSIPTSSTTTSSVSRTSSTTISTSASPSSIPTSSTTTSSMSISTQSTSSTATSSMSTSASSSKSIQSTATPFITSLSTPTPTRSKLISANSTSTTSTTSKGCPCATLIPEPAEYPQTADCQMFWCGCQLFALAGNAGYLLPGSALGLPSSILLCDFVCADSSDPATVESWAGDILGIYDIPDVIDPMSDCAFPTGIANIA